MEATGGGRFVTELYLADKEAKLADELYRTGLIQSVNAVLHPHGLALGVSINPDEHGGTVDGLSLHETSDPRGIWYDEETTKFSRAKLVEAGLVRERRTVAAQGVEYD